mmetsp:Transcript_42720/g.50027  ORF Transcript_42720/g.50027 Transcript_42720/m.50027 type:complete len:656 (-) Transcript_42720:1095-3062(-)
MNELIDNIKVIKMNSWVDCYFKKVLDLKNKEYTNSVLSTLLWLPNRVIYIVGKYILIFGVFIIIVAYFEIPLGVASTVAIMKVLEQIQGNLGYFSYCYRIYSKFALSSKRIEDFLQCDEIEDFLKDHCNQADTELAISIEKSNFFWGFDYISDEDIKQFKEKKDKQAKEQSNKEAGLVQSEEEDKTSANITLDDRIVLKSVNLKVRRGEFVAIIGDVGSGKSSLLGAVLGEMLYFDDSVLDKYKNVTLDFKNDLEQTKQLTDEINECRKQASLNSKTRIAINGTVSLVEQKPFILNKTIRDNILFGEDLDETKYNRVVGACELGKDLELLAGGDLTEIGEKGINLSGGQKARVSIARAVYADADIVLMDDPLSALDAHVKRRVFDQVCCGELAGKTRLLVTHAVDFLDRVDRILVLEEGRITLNGSYDELKAEPYFAKIISTLQKSKSADADNESSSEKSDSDKPKTEAKNYMSSEGTKITDDDDKCEVTWTTYWKYLAYLKYTLVILALSMGVTVIGDLITMNNEYSVLQWVKEYSKTNDPNYSGMISLIFIAFCLLIVDLVRDFFDTWQNYIIEKRLFSDMISKVMNASIPLYFDRSQSGTILQRLNTDQPSASKYCAGHIKWAVSMMCQMATTLAIVSYYVPSILILFPACV